MLLEVEMEEGKEKVAKESLRRRQIELLHRILPCSYAAPGVDDGPGDD